MEPESRKPCTPRKPLSLHEQASEEPEGGLSEMGAVHLALEVPEGLLPAEGGLFGTWQPANDLAAVSLSLARPFPGFSVVPPAVIPAAPLLEIASIEELRRRLFDAWRAGTEKYTSRRVRHALGDKYAVMLGSTAVLLLASQFAPAAWIAFAFARWPSSPSRLQLGGERPPITWALNSQQVLDLRDWFLDEKNSYCSRRELLGPLHRELIAHWRRFEKALRTGELSAEDVEACWPAEFYLAEVETARRESAALSVRYAEEVAEGGWPW